MRQNHKDGIKKITVLYVGTKICIRKYVYVPKEDSVNGTA